VSTPARDREDRARFVSRDNSKLDAMAGFSMRARQHWPE
jgi:hypothetical protein